MSNHCTTTPPRHAELFSASHVPQQVQDDVVVLQDDIVQKKRPASEEEKSAGRSDMYDQFAIRCED